METEILSALARANVAAGAAIIAILLLRKPVRAWFGARAAYGLWLLAPFAALAVLAPRREVVEAATPYIDVPSETLSYATPISLNATDIAPLFEAPPAPASVWSAVSDAAAPVLDNAGLVFAAWIAGVALSFGLLVWRQHRYLAALGRLERAKADGAPVFRTQKEGVGPALVGALRPRIVLPADFETRFSADERAMILAHERTHLTAGDAQVNALIAVVTCVCWFNPLAYVAAIFARRDQELACDSDVVAAHPGGKKRYAEALLKTQMAMGAVPLGCAWPAQGDHPLRERIVLLGAARPNFARRLAGGAAITALSIGAGAMAWAVQPPLIVVAAAPVELTHAVSTPQAALAVEALTFETPVVEAVEPAIATAEAVATAPAASVMPIAETRTAAGGAFAAAPVEIFGAAGLLRVIPENRSDIAISISGGSRLQAPSARMERGRLIIDGGLGERGNRCQRRFTGEGSAQVPGVGSVAVADLPVITLRTPMQIDLYVRGAVASDIGALTGGRIMIAGCGDARIARSSALDVGLFGIGHVNAGAVAGALNAELSGLGDLTIAGAGGDANVELNGTGDLSSGSIGGALNARLQGTGDLNIGDVARGAQLMLGGAGDLSVGDIIGETDVNVGGAGDVRVASVRGNIAIDIGGSSDVEIAAGAADRMDVRISGSGDVTFGGRAGLVRSRLGGGAGDVRVAHAERVENTGAGEGNVIIDDR